MGMSDLLLEQMGGEAVPERVQGDALVDPRLRVPKSFVPIVCHLLRAVHWLRIIMDDACTSHIATAAPLGS
jgi:hypothetical protein